MDRTELEERTKKFSINVIQLVATLHKNKATDVIRAYLKNEKMTCTLPECHVYFEYYDTTKRTL
jgi:hypothetical protein